MIREEMGGGGGGQLGEKKSGRRVCRKKSGPVGGKRHGNLSQEMKKLDQKAEAYSAGDRKKKVQRQVLIKERGRIKAKSQHPC